MNWNRIIAFKDEQGQQVGTIESAVESGAANFKIIGRIWSWTADHDSLLRLEIESALKKGIKTAVVYGSSEGGSVFATTEIANLLMGFDSVKIKVGALMASAFTYLTSKFHTTIKSNTQGMIHMPISIVKGNIKDVKADLKLLENITQDYIETYAQKTGKTSAQIQSLWKDGDYWMSAKELKEQGFVDAIEGSIESFAETDINALVACGAPNIPKLEKKLSKKTTINHHQMNRETLIALYGLESDAEDKDILAAARKIKVDALKYQELQKLQKDKQAAEKQAKATALVEAAIKEKKITADQKFAYEKLAQTDYESTKAVLDGLQGVPKLTSAISPQGGHPSREKWTLDDYLDKDPQAYEQLKTEDPQKAAELEKQYYNQK